MTENRSEQGIEGWTVGEHVAEACRLLDGPDVSTDEWDAARADNVNTARAHIALAALLIEASRGQWRINFTADDIPVGGADQ